MLVYMKRFRYRIYKGKQLVLTNWIDAETKEKAIADYRTEFYKHN